jgi:hypothetical protein
MQITRIGVILAAIAFSSVNASADEVEPPAAGTRIRVDLSGAKQPLMGDYVVLGKGSLTITVDGVMRVIAREQIQRLAVSGGRPSRARRALVGGAIGAVAAVPAAAFSGEWRIEGPLAAIGAVIGFSLPVREKWNEIDIGHAHVMCVPGVPRGLGITVAVAF